MKILSIVTQLESGGAQTVAVQLHRTFLEQGYQSHLVFLYEKDQTVFPQRDYDTALPHRVRSPADLARLLWRLRSIWQTFAPDAVIAHTHFSNNLAAMMKTTGLHGRLFPVHHNIYESYPAISRSMDALARRLGLYEQEIAVSHPVFNSIGRAAPSSSLTTVLNGLELRPSRMSRSEARTAFGLPDSGFLIGNIGRLAEQKNQKFLISLLRALPNSRVAILGEGELRDELITDARSQGVDERLHLIGTVVHERVPDFLRALDVFAMPSLFEGLSIAMLEAFAAGVPFVGNDIPSIAAVTAGNAGSAIPLSVESWLGELKKIQDDHSYASELSSRQLNRAKDFTLDAMTENYLAAIGAV